MGNDTRVKLSHQGRTYSFDSVSAAARHFGVNQSTASRRIAVRGWTVKQALGLEPAKKKTDQSITVNGKQYKSIADAARDFGVPPRKAASRIRKGWTPEEAVGAVMKTDGVCNPITVTFQGKSTQYRSIHAACNALGYDVSIVKQRIRKGYTAEEAFGWSLPVAVCQECGEQYEHNYNTARKFCSAACSARNSRNRPGRKEEINAYQSKRYLEKKKQQYCKHCGEPIPKESRARKFCDTTCKAAHRRSTPEGRAMVFARQQVTRIPPNARNKSIRSIEHTGKSAHDLTAYIESLWSPGMTWDNHGRGKGTWQFDHIMPMKGEGVDLLNPVHQRAIMDYRNLRPMWSDENKDKSNAVTPAARRLFNKLVKEFS